MNTNTKTVARLAKRYRKKCFIDFLGSILPFQNKCAIYAEAVAATNINSSKIFCGYNYSVLIR